MEILQDLYDKFGEIVIVVAGFVYIYMQTLKKDKEKEEIRNKTNVKIEEMRAKSNKNLSLEIKNMSEKFEKFGLVLESLVVKDVQVTVRNDEIREENKEMYIKTDFKIHKLGKEVRENLNKANENILEVKNMVQNYGRS